MSGVKMTPFELKQEEKARQKALAGASKQQAIVHDIGRRIQEMLAGMPDGVKKSFSSQTGTANTWLRQKLPTVSPDLGRGTLASHESTLSDIAMRGKRILADLECIIEHKRDARARELSDQCTSALSRIAGEKELLDKWMPGSHERFRAFVNALKHEIDNGEFPKVEAAISRLNRQLDADSRRVSSFEEKDMARRHVYTALHDVCRQMGWKPMEEARLEDPDDPGSDLLFAANTYSAGIMDFRLSLDSIEVHSPITSMGKTCHHDFDMVSDKLKKFGIKTAFKQSKHRQDTPKLIEDDAIDIPIVQARAIES